MAMNWHVVSVTSGYEIKCAARISEAGFNAVCPVWTKKIRRPNRGGIFFGSKIEPLFSRYFFLQEDEAFEKSEFETEKVRLKIFRNVLLTPEQMSEVRVIEMKVASEQMRAKHGLTIEVGDVVQIIEGVMLGEPIEIERVDRGRLLVRRKLQKDARSFWVNRTSVGKAI